MKKKKGKSNMHCILVKDLNTYPFYIADAETCTNDAKCSFRQDDSAEKAAKYERKERWYEKYLLHGQQAKILVY